MAIWTYDPTLTAARDRVRFYIGDTIERLAFVYNEEIEGMLTVTPDEMLCAAEICESQAAQSAQLVDYSVGGGAAMRVNLSQRGQAFAMRAKTLRHRAGLKHSKPFAGGISRASASAQREDTDRISPAFARIDVPPQLPEDLLA